MLNFSILLLLLGLLTQPASSQALRPLPPRVVRLDSGDVAVRRYDCMDSADYRRVRVQAAQLLDYRQRTRMLEGTNAILQHGFDQQHAAGRVAGHDFDALAHDARALEAVKPARPLLLDAHTYQGAAAGAVALIALKFFLHF